MGEASSMETNRKEQVTRISVDNFVGIVYHSFGLTQPMHVHFFEYDKNIKKIVNKINVLLRGLALWRYLLDGKEVSLPHAVICA